ncbi:hypothetical protein [Bacillus gaemokensis]|uniref:Uncharacterized protein n=1 Tax=Bacillus gaemokensis TaxID=574375 RepID=A0A073KBH6_9BACI|nr:hypothetical protein [Bacillus gaemokensis]KEK23861.1 hypothetical protein BAGA_05300 [Bacillus gaemokensis]KYG38101.1 hypothetical protein AZF08_20335 [Bacillus gaemokensis]
MKKEKLKLRPWVKMTLAFVVGVSIISNIFSIFGTSASTDDNMEEKIIAHGIIEVNVNGESYLKMIDKVHGSDVVVKTKEEYNAGQIITVELEGNRVVSDKITEGEELEKLYQRYNDLIEEYNASIKNK